jgi:arsenate reductase (glutaredoxin)
MTNRSSPVCLESPPLMSLVIETFYWLPYCSTCTKAEAWLKSQGVTIKNLVDIKSTPLSKEIILQLCKALGSEEALFSKRAMKYRSLGLHERTLTAEEMLHYMALEYTFIKRPVAVFSTGQVQCGFSEKAYKTLLETLRG